MFVLEALLLTFITTPLVTVLYPPNKRVRVAATGAKLNGVAYDEEGGQFTDSKSEETTEERSKTRFTVILDKLDHLPSMMALTQLINPSPSPVCPRSESGSTEETRISSPHNHNKSTELFIDAHRLIELSDRVSAVMKSSASDTLVHTDPLLAIFRMFGQLNDLPISTSLSIVTFDDLSYSVVEHARNNASDLIMLPWLPPSFNTTDSISPANDGTMAPKPAPHTSNNPFDAMFRSTGGMDKSALHSHFVRGVFSQSTTDVALFVDQGVPGSQTGSAQHVFLPFFGGPDDRLALEFVVQLCVNPKITATVVRVVKRDVDVPVTQAANARLRDEKAAEETIALTVTSVYCILYHFVMSLLTNGEALLGCSCFPRYNIWPREYRNAYAIKNS
jgi:hypothetical protein